MLVTPKNVFPIFCWHPQIFWRCCLSVTSHKIHLESWRSAETTNKKSYYYSRTQLPKRNVQEFCCWGFWIGSSLKGSKWQNRETSQFERRIEDRVWDVSSSVVCGLWFVFVFPLSSVDAWCLPDHWPTKSSATGHGSVEFLDNPQRLTIIKIVYDARVFIGIWNAIDSKAIFNMVWNYILVYLEDEKWPNLWWNFIGPKVLENFRSTYFSRSVANPTFVRNEGMNHKSNRIESIESISISQSIAIRKPNQSPHFQSLPAAAAVEILLLRRNNTKEKNHPILSDSIVTFD